MYLYKIIGYLIDIQVLNKNLDYFLFSEVKIFLVYYLQEQ